MSLESLGKHRDHRELGQLLDLFSFHEIAPGAPFWHGNGMIIFRELEKVIRQMNDDHGYQEVSTPIMVKTEVFKKSGHWDHYRQNIFYFNNPVDEKEQLAIKPMNCPESTYIYNSTIRSYRDLPLRLAEIGRLHRNELSGTLGGLFRVRQITMDDAHIYCRPDQVEDEVKNLIHMIGTFYGIFGLEPTYVLATRPKQALGEASQWDMAEKALTNGLKGAGAKFDMLAGEGAFYGPKIEFHLRDSQDRDWQMGTIQLDLVMLPEQFAIFYIDEDGSKKQPWVIHRAVLGSFERFIGMILEHFDGQLPAWLAPVQAVIVTVSDAHIEYARSLAEQLAHAGVRVKVDDQNATVGKKIREAEVKKIPFIVTVGDKEIAEQTVSVRDTHTKKVSVLPIADFIKEIVKNTKSPTV